MDAGKILQTILSVLLTVWSNAPDLREDVADAGAYVIASVWPDKAEGELGQVFVAIGENLIAREQGSGT
jgi:hypothetical protein